MFGSAIVKLAVALILVGGVQQKSAESTTKQRGESHLLLVGDPGTGKSQFLKYAAKIATRSVLTTGIGTTTAGLTVSAVKDKGGDWILEAGALVLADGGICCIDEFGSIQEKDKTSIHEAMEQQTLSIAKAGLICNLQTRCSIIAATNPKGKYDPDEDLSINLAMGSPLLSRFDLVLIMMDQVDLDWDRTVSDFILRGDRNSPIPVNPDCWSLEKLQAYFSHVKAKWAPVLTEEARATLSRYYQRQRAADLRNVARITIRMLESLIRLAEAHAKLCYRGTVELQDAIVSIIVMEFSIAGTAILGAPSVVRSLFPDDPELDYREKEEIILKTLSLTEYLRRPTQRR